MTQTWQDRVGSEGRPVAQEDPAGTATLGQVRAQRGIDPLWKQVLDRGCYGGLGGEVVPSDPGLVGLCCRDVGGNGARVLQERFGHCPVEALSGVASALQGVPEPRGGR